MAAHLLRSRTGLARSFALGAAVLAYLLLTPAARAQSQAVKDLRDALAIGATELRPTKQTLEFRRKAVQDAIVELKSANDVNDLYQALVLPDWKDEASAFGIETGLREVDAPLRRQVKDLLLGALQKGLHDNTSKVAVATFIGEMALSLRTGTVSEPFGLTRDLSPDLIRLSEDDDAAVRSAAIGALGNINPVNPPNVEVDKEGTVRIVEDKQQRLKLVSAALQRLLIHDKVGPRRAAGKALATLVQTMIELEKVELTQTLREVQKQSGGPGSVRRSGTGIRRQDVILVAATVVDLAGRGAEDADTAVRLHSLKAIQLAAGELEKMVPPDPVDYFKNNTNARLKKSPFPKYLFLRPSAPDSPAGKEILSMRQGLLEENRIYQPLMTALGDQGAVLSRHLRDEDDAIRLVTRKALESMAAARQRLQNLWDFIPPLAEERKGAEPLQPVSFGEEEEEITPLLKGLSPSLDQIAGGMTDKDARVRLASAEFLEMLGRDALPAVAALVKALRDSDPFVRWTAARAPAHLAPARPAEVVPALSRSLADPDLDARMAAAVALQRYGVLGAAAGGPLAEETRTVLERYAVPALDRATRIGDTEARMAAIAALVAVVDGGADRAVDALIAALKNPDVRVRRDAADALGRIRSPSAQKAVGALQEALSDSDDEVRRRASASLLTIRQQGQRGRPEL